MRKEIPPIPSSINLILIEPADTEIKKPPEIDPQLKKTQKTSTVALTYHAGREVQRTAERNSTQELRNRSTQFYTHTEGQLVTQNCVTACRRPKQSIYCY